MSSTPRIGIIGGSGLYQMDGLELLEERRVETPYGDPSDAYLIGRLNGSEVVFLARHGRGHKYNPSEINFRANIWGMKKLGVDWIVSISAVGSLRADVVPGHMVLIDQFIDRTKSRHATFFEKGIVAHVAFGNPVCGTLRRMLLDAAQEVDAVVHDGGTYVCMEGPAFSTKAESELYRSWGARVVGMTNLPEAKLAREAEISYATLAMSTDYDCWHPDHDDVTVDAVIAVMQKNTATAQRILAAVVPKIASFGAPAPESSALQGAIFTPPADISPEVAERLRPIIGKYLV
jgi:5'-methylthioadenosine phosphorylase